MPRIILRLKIPIDDIEEPKNRSIGRTDRHAKQLEVDGQSQKKTESEDAEMMDRWMKMGATNRLEATESSTSRMIIKPPPEYMLMMRTAVRQGDQKTLRSMPDPEEWSRQQVEKAEAQNSPLIEECMEADGALISRSITLAMERIAAALYVPGRTPIDREMYPEYMEMMRVAVRRVDIPLFMNMPEPKEWSRQQK